MLARVCAWRETVFDDCDFEATVQGAVRSSFLNSGQICLCSSRLFVQAGIYDKFMKAFVAAVNKVRVRGGAV